MKIRLLAPDSKIPNYAIMKISAYHKQLGDDVEWYKPDADMQDTDVLYISKVFTFSEDPRATTPMPEHAEIKIGGTGHDKKSELPAEIENITKLEMLCRYVKPYKITVYVLVGFENKEIIETDLERVMTLKAMKVNPFAMGYMNFDDPSWEKSQSVKDFCRWVNMKAIFKTVSWDTYRTGKEEARMKRLAKKKVNQNMVKKK